MYALKPTSIHLHEGLTDNADAMTRVDRILSALGKSRADVRTYDEADVYDVAREINAWPPAEAPTNVPIEHQRPIVLTRLSLGGVASGDPIVAGAPDDAPKGIVGNALGYIDPIREYHSYDSDIERNMVCWPTRDFGVAAGCSHGCFYCGDGKFGKHLALGMNIDEFMEQVVERAIHETPDQRCFRMMGWGADAISLEPEYGVFRSYLATLAKHDRYGYFHSNSDNVDWIADEPNRDRLIGVWSLASEGVASQIEPGSPTAAARIEAMRKLQEMGVPIRIKLKPTIPIIGWREDYAALIESVFAAVQPETIGFCVMIWMTLEVLNTRFPGLIDPDFVCAAEESVGEMDGETHSPFPHAKRAEIYRFLTAEVRKHDANIPIFLSTETREMWVELAEEIGQNPRMFMCGCNPVQLPGPKMKTGETIPASTWFEPTASGEDA